MSPDYGRPYVKAQKNGDRDAEAIAEAATRPTMRFVTPKTPAQLDLQTLHCVRDRMVLERTALINQLRAILLERGIRAPKGRSKFSRCLTEWFDDAEADLPAALSPRSRDLIAALRAEWRALDERIAALDAEFAERVRQDEAARRLTSIPGIGALDAMALLAAGASARRSAVAATSRPATERKRSHGELANRILAGTTAKTGKLSYRALQKMFGRSAQVPGCGMFV